jgi:Collagen triple helix repeat (20 copies)
MLTTLRICAATVIAVAGFNTPAVAADQTIHACVGVFGLTRVISATDHCKNFEVPVSWSTKLQGPTGETGPQGLAGPQGQAGLAGPPGLLGLVGPAGVQGLTGAQGVPGLNGPAGAPGPIGPQGVQGESGAQGPAGSVGPQGIAGVDGPAGVSGGLVVVDANNTALGNFLSFDPNTYQTLVAGKIGGDRYSLYVSPSTQVAALNILTYFYKSQTCTGTPLIPDPSTSNMLVPQVAGFGLLNEMFIADLNKPIVAIGGWTPTDYCPAPEPVSVNYIYFDSSANAYLTSQCYQAVSCGPFRDQKSLGILSTTPPYRIQ